MADNPIQDRELKLPVVPVKGRYFTKYNPNLALDIIERIAEGEYLTDITARDAIEKTVAYSTFMRWVATVPELAVAFKAAKQLSAMVFEEKGLIVAEKIAKEPKTPQHVSAASLLVHQYQWSAARRDPTNYSDKGNTNIVVPVNITTSLNLGNGSAASGAEVPDIYTIKFPAKQIVEGEFSEVSKSETQSLTQPNDGQSLIDSFKEAARQALRVSEPFKGVDRQPIYANARKSKGVKGPRKRVLKPRMPKEKK